jgi:hypothetical protein
MTTTEKDLREFVEQVAQMIRPGDLLDGPTGELYPYHPDDFCSDPDAQALYNLIDRARVLTNSAPAQPARALATDEDSDDD